MSSRLVSIGYALTVLAFAAACGLREEGAQGGEDSAAFDEAAEPISVVVEIDQLADTPRFPDDIEVGGQTVSVESIFARAGVDLQIIRSDPTLPKASPLATRDLESYMHDHRDRSIQPPFIYCLIAHQGPKAIVRGVLFATDQRDGVAVFVHDLAGLTPARRDREMVRRLAHELAHAFNLHHADLEGSFRANGSIESSSDESTVLWRLSQHSLEHFARHPRCELLPGSGSPFRTVTSAHEGSHRDTDETYNRDACNLLAGGARTGVPVARSARAPAVATAMSESQLRLELTAPKSEFALGEPVVVQVALENTGQEDVEVNPSLMPEEGVLNFEIQGPGTQPFRAFVPFSIQEPPETELVRLKGGEKLPRDVKVFFGAGGWTLREPGRYRLRATYPVSEADPAPRLRAELVLTVTEPAPGIADEVEALINDPEMGQFLLFEGAAHLPEARGRLLAFLERNEAQPQAPALQALLLLDAINPPINPATGRELPTRFQDARILIAKLRDPRILQDLPLSTFARAGLLEAELLGERGDMSAARNVLAETAAALRQAQPAVANEMIFGEQEAREVLESVIREIPRSRETLEAQGIDVDAILDEGDGENR